LVSSISSSYFATLTHGAHMMTSSEKDATRNSYRHFMSIPTRWMDNDVYGHVNNVIYYSYFDTAVNKWLIDRGLLDYLGGDTIGLVVATACSYFRQLAFPDTVEAGIRVAHLGRSSVRYEIGLFRNDENVITAAGAFTHVYVDRMTRRPVPVSEQMRAALSDILSIRE
jgi:acyl-CoA thioester hydrolase